MKKNKDILRHEMLNVLTVLHLLLEDEDLDAESQADALKKIELLSILIRYEKLFLEEEISLFLQKTSLRDSFFELEALEEYNISLPGEGDILLETDRYHFLSGMQEVFDFFLSRSKESALLLQEKQRTLCLMHSLSLDEIPQKKPLLLMLKEKDQGALSFQLGLHLLDALGIQIQQKKGEMRFLFSKPSS